MVKATLPLPCCTAALSPRILPRHRESKSRYKEYSTAMTSLVQGREDIRHKNCVLFNLLKWYTIYPLRTHNNQSGLFNHFKSFILQRQHFPSFRLANQLEAFQILVSCFIPATGDLPLVDLHCFHVDLSPWRVSQGPRGTSSSFLTTNNQAVNKAEKKKRDIVLRREKWPSALQPCGAQHKINMQKTPLRRTSSLLISFKCPRMVMF